MTDPLNSAAIGGVSAPPRIPAGAAPSGGAAASAPDGRTFAEHLRRRSGGIEFSKHALQRVERRGIATSGPTLQRLQSGVERAAGKGSRDAVVLVDDAAFVVSVRNRTVVTALDSKHMREHVFTNIDSAVIA